MAQYLSPEWFSEMKEAAASYVADSPAEGTVSMRETVTGTPFGDVTYVMTIDGGRVQIDTDADVVADVTFTQDYATASDMHRGKLTTQEAFFGGKVKVAGHLNTLLENAEVLQGISPAFKEVRERTTY